MINSQYFTHRLCPVVSHIYPPLFMHPVYYLFLYLPSKLNEGVWLTRIQECRWNFKRWAVFIFCLNRECKWQQTNVIPSVLTKEPATSRKSQKLPMHLGPFRLSKLHRALSNAVSSFGCWKGDAHPKTYIACSYLACSTWWRENYLHRNHLAHIDSHQSLWWYWR